jgi:hypothetical protein
MLKLTPAERESISTSKDRTNVLAKRHGVSLSYIKEIRREGGRTRADDRGGVLPGTPKNPNSGRKPGTPMKRTVLAREILAKHGCDPIEMLARTMADEKNVPLDLRMDCAKSLLPYVYPKLSAVEVSGPDGDSVRVEHEHTLMMRMMGDPLLVRRMEDLVIQQAEQERHERGLLPVYHPELPSA